MRMEICSDCLYVSANGTPDYDGYGVSGHAGRYALAVKLHGGEPLSDDYDASFSWNSCDFCGDFLGGARFTANVYDMAGK